MNISRPLDSTPPTTPAFGGSGIELEVFSACPASVGDLGRTYLDRIRDVAQWSEHAGCRGTLVYCDNRLVDPWLLAQFVVQSTRRLSPLVAVQPVYMHPYSVAKMIATLSSLHGRKVFVNWIAGGFKHDLEALADSTPHDERYDRLVEYATMVRQLTDGCTVTSRGKYFEARGLSLQPSVAPELRPDFLLSGSSPAGEAAVRALDARAVTYALPADSYESQPARPGLPSGLRLGVIARTERNEAWRVAYQRFPPERQGALTRALARKVSDSHWHEQMCRTADERAESQDPYWMVPFENYKTMCPYLVGSHDEVAQLLAQYVRRGFHTYILDEPEREEDLVNARFAFELATEKTLVAA
jgi:alkanesulfonate monooxygenase